MTQTTHETRDVTKAVATMGSIALPLEALNSRATRIIATSRQKQRRAERMAVSARVRSLSVSYAETLPDLFILGRQIRSLADDLNRDSESLHGASFDEIKTLAHQLNQVAQKVASILRRYESIGISDVWISRYILNPLRDSNGRLECIVEGLHMSISEDFGEMVAHAAKELSAALFELRSISPDIDPTPMLHEVMYGD